MLKPGSQQHKCSASTETDPDTNTDNKLHLFGEDFSESVVRGALLPQRLDVQDGSDQTFLIQPVLSLFWHYLLHSKTTEEKKNSNM